MSQATDQLIRNTIFTTMEEDAAMSAKRALEGTAIDELHVVIGYGIDQSVMMIFAPVSGGALLSAESMVEAPEIQGLSASLQQLVERARATLESSGFDLPTKWWLRIELVDGEASIRSRGEYGDPVDLRGSNGRAVGKAWSQEIERDVNGRSKLLVGRDGSNISLAGDLSQIATVD